MLMYKAFISYKHVKSTGFAQNLELAVKAYAKPVYRPPVSLFRDEKYLRAGIDLPAMIRNALNQSEYFIYLASPEAAASAWVQDELNYWCDDKDRCQRLIIVLTDGKIVADARTKRLDWDRTNALPRSLEDKIRFVPLFVDLSWARRKEQQTVLEPEYKKALEHINIAQKLNPRSYQINSNKIEYLLMLDKISDAEEFYKSNNAFL